MRILIVEDELLLAEMLGEILADFGYRDVVKTHSYDEAMHALKSTDNFDLAILDVNIGLGKTGVDIASWMQENYNADVFFLTSYSDKKTLTNAAKTQPDSYLIKPIRPNDLLAALTMVNAKREQAEQVITIKDGYKKVRLDLNDLLYIHSDHVYIVLETKNKRYILRSSLDKFLQEYSFDELKRVHRSYIVNLSQISEYNSQTIWIGEHKIPISRSYKKEVLSFLS